jgi:hypothetical protein
MELQIFGKMRTGVFIDSLSEENILKSIRAGMSIITDGPVVNMRVFSLPKQMSSIGCNYSGSTHSIQLDALSSIEYGSIESLKIFKGNIGQTEVELISEKSVKGYNSNREFSFKPECKSYLRAELWTSSKDSSDNQQHFCLTNPIWFSPT